MVRALHQLGRQAPGARVIRLYDREHNKIPEFHVSRPCIDWFEIINLRLTAPRVGFNQTVFIIADQCVILLCMKAG